MLAPVLGELDRPAQRPGRHRHQQLLRPGVDDLDAEAAAHVGGDHVDLAEVEAELGRDGGAYAGRGLGRGPHLEAVEVGVPAGHGAAALHRHEALRSMSRSRVSRCGAAAMAAGASPTFCSIRAATLPGTSSCTRCSAARAAAMPTTGGRNS